MFSISPSLRLTKSPDGGVLLDIERGTMFSLNPVATRIIELLQRQHNRSSLVHEVSCDFAVPEAVVAADVDEFLSILRTEQWLDEPEASAGGRA